MKTGKKRHYQLAQIRHYSQTQVTDISNKDGWINTLMKAIKTLATLYISGDGAKLMM